MVKPLTLPDPISIEIYCDASFAPKLGVGVGAFAVVKNPTDKLAPNISTEVFQAATCGRLEFLVAIWALEFFFSLCNTSTLDSSGSDKLRTITLYTDSRSIADLPRRRDKLVANKFTSQRTGGPLANSDLYQKFLRVFDDLNLQIHWLKGHTAKSLRSVEGEVFAKIDQAARKQLRSYLKSADLGPSG